MHCRRHAELGAPPAQVVFDLPKRLQAALKQGALEVAVDAYAEAAPLLKKYGHKVGSRTQSVWMYCPATHACAWQLDGANAAACRAPCVGPGASLCGAEACRWCVVEPSVWRSYQGRVPWGGARVEGLSAAVHPHA